ncbi:LysR family transcriptional regulator [Salmonella enterica subsp. enterica serovar Dortmund]|uniref:LysR family transcriptional regulator n=1 Tax=Salmonella enterica TaxID=28901 RepID=UPI000F9D582D|nr:LysR family transcriptional regulator [Salmonella enterica]EBU7940404.1 LysR family transcriptional regulator [Salmonella enterica subsp. enterica serovar Chittagong]EBX6017045.1 LysR family transcriptional regulator [Salmonella enterica subsp. enterica serovar Dortmund]ECA8971152.1 LysR family transcriptional regulator [Salmonella enterica subsp. enterica serovar Omuna]ECE0503864.1 LysR family transcriptional regulator [Salmonella enterica subsp. enterica]EDH3990831.1 LysR family transcrip
MDLKKLRSFIRVAEQSSFSQAAQILDQSQSMISRQVRQLEEELGTTLLQRNGRGVTLTAAGRKLLEHGKGILHQVEIAEQVLNTDDGIYKGKVTVGMPPTVGKLLTVGLVSDFLNEFPDCSLAITENLTYWLQKRLIMGELDIAILYNPLPERTLKYQLLWTEKLCLIAPSQSELAGRECIPLQELSIYPLIIPNRQQMLRNLVEIECARHDVTLNVVLEIDTVSSMLGLVSRGFGYSVLPANALEVEFRPEGLIAIPINPPILNRVILATSQQHHFSSLAQRTMELLLQQDIISQRLAGR